MEDDRRVEIVDAETIRRWLEAGEAELFDVREPAEHQEWRIPGARSVPLSSLDPESVVAPPGRRVVLHCKSGVRCGIAAERLRAAGRTEPLYRLSGGILAWSAAGLPVER